ncbi:MAG: hypothetical protein AB1489_01805 [Acidobacteriota bacterium]
MTPQIVFALYRPHEGKDEELRKLIAQHVPTLRKLELITDRPAVLVKSKNGTYIEIFEWRTAQSSEQAHHHPEVAKVWEAMDKVADLPALDTLEEIKGRFPHFEPVNL